jgi:hypothetical protein
MAEAPVTDVGALALAGLAVFALVALSLLGMACASWAAARRGDRDK